MQKNIFTKVLCGVAQLSLLVHAAVQIPTLPHDKIRTIYQDALPADSVYVRFAPSLHIDHGCVPFPAVDAQGRMNQGLAPAGPSDGGCTSSPGQVYLRVEPYQGLIAMMYAWYFPKEQTSSSVFVVSGQRHFWAHIIVWLESSTAREPLAVSTSIDGEYFTHTEDRLGQAINPTIYKVVGGTALLPASGKTSEPLEEPLALWNIFPDYIKGALDHYNFDSPGGQIEERFPNNIHCPFNAANFETNLKKAYNFR